MRRSLGVTFLCVLSFVAGAAVQHLYERRARAPQVMATGATGAGGVVEGSSAVVDFSREPLWAYGFLQPPVPGDKAVPQLPPSRAMRPNEDAAGQTRARQLPGSTASYSLVDIRDAGHVADWYAQDHPPMPDIIRLGPAKMTTGRRGCGFCHLPNGLGRPENAPTAALPRA